MSATSIITRTLNNIFPSMRETSLCWCQTCLLEEQHTDHRNFEGTAAVNLGGETAGWGPQSLIMCMLPQTQTTRADCGHKNASLDDREDKESYAIGDHSIEKKYQLVKIHIKEATDQIVSLLNFCQVWDHLWLLLLLGLKSTSIFPTCPIIWKEGRAFPANQLESLITFDVFLPLCIMGLGWLRSVARPW